MIFRFLRRLRRRRARQIFHYSDGLASRSIDPLHAFFELQADPDEWTLSDLEELGRLGEVANPTPTVMATVRELTERTTDVVKRVFEVDDYDPATGRGLTIEEQLQLLGGFVAFMDGVKKKQEAMRKRWEPTESTSSAPIGNVPVPDALVGPADISAEELDAIMDEWKEKTRTPDEVEEDNPAPTIPVVTFSPPAEIPSNASLEATADESTPQPAKPKPLMPSASGSSSTKTASTSGDPSLASKQLLQQSTPRPLQEP